MDYKQYLRPGKGATDITKLLSDNEAFKSLIGDLTEVFADTIIDKVVCIDGWGTLLGAPTAYALGVGLIPIRSPGKLRNEVFSEIYTDYSGKEKTLEIHRDSLKNGERVLLIDDWVETGSTVMTAVKLIEKCGGKVVGIGTFMDDTKPEVHDKLKQYNYKYVAKVESGDNF